MNDNECTQLETISLDQLEHVNGGGWGKVFTGAGKAVTKAYQWWTDTAPKLPSPKELFDEGTHILKEIGAVTGITAAATWAWKKTFGRGDTPKPRVEE